MPLTETGKRRKQDRPDPDQTYIAIDSGVVGSVLGEPVVKKGDRLRGDSAVVEAARHLFVEDGTSDQEIARRVAELKGYDQGFTRAAEVRE